MKKVLSSLILLISLFAQSLALPPGSDATIVGGTISTNTTWSGDILVVEMVKVLPEVVLTILPGTRVRFQHYRGYREPEKRLRIEVFGEIHANGTPAEPIYFTSDAADPQNGDWSMLRLISNTGLSSFHYVVFEFAQHGLNVWNSSPEISHSMFRWNNWEGVYFESYCGSTILHTQIMENGYNGLAAEQLNNLTLDQVEVWRNGTSGVHIDNSTAIVRVSLIHDNLAHGLSVDNNSIMRAYGDAIYANQACGIGFGEGSNTVYIANLDFKTGNGNQNLCGSTITEPSTLYPPAAVDIGFTPDNSYALGYIPGDELLDGYMYVYPDDETRHIVRKIGDGLGLTWGVAYHAGSVWAVTLQAHIYRLNPYTGAIEDHFTVPASPQWGALSQPWGMAFDDQGMMWVVDFAERKLFKINPYTEEIIYSFDTPNASAGGCKGLAWDGNNLNVMGWITPEIYKMDPDGNLIETISLDSGGSGGLAWDGLHYWVPSGGRILKYSKSGHQVGWIYAASEGTWDMSWDGAYLWATQRTNENWLDAKIFQLEILEDHDHQIFLPLVLR